MTIEINGEITDIFPAELVTSNFEKRVTWVKEVDVQYPNTYPLEFHQGDVNLLDNFVPGDLVTCKVDVRGRQWNKGGKSGCMVTLKCWSISRTGTAARPAPSTRQQTGGIPPKNEPKAPQDGQPPVVGQDDDLPF
jgi:hypothetical protein